MVNHFRAFHFRTVGASHVKAGTVCQDYTLSAEKPELRYAVVCDGHGGDDYFRSDRGSRFAAESFAVLIKNRDFLDALQASPDEKKRNNIVGQFVKSLISRWNICIYEDMEREPFSDEEMQNVSSRAHRRYTSGEHVQSAYGTTLIGAVLTNDFWFGIQIGDGKCVAVNENGEFSQPVPWDENCFLNVTTSICDENAAAEFRYCYSETLPAALFLGSDGIDDCFAGEEKLYGFYRVVLHCFADFDEESAENELNDYLPSLSEKGSGDDMSVAMILNMDFIKNNQTVFQKKPELFLSVTRSGDFGGDNPNDSYYQTAEIKAVPGVYSLEELDCGGFHEGVSEFEILSVHDNEIIVTVNEKVYTVTTQNDIEIADKCQQTSYDGPSWTAEDVLEFKLIRK